MWNYLWPVILIVGSNIIYNITTKSTPKNANSFLTLAVTYLVGSALSFVLFLFSSSGKGIIKSFGELNWTSYVLSFAIVGLETGYIYLYRAGWKISVGSLVSNILLAVMLIIIGVMFYKENLGTKQIAGIILCIGGLVLINM